MRCLEVIDADLAARDVRSDRQHGHVVALRVKQAVDEMEVARTAAARADRELAREVGLGAGCEGGTLFVANVNPLDGVQRPQGIGEAVQRVATDAINALDARLGEGLRHEVRCGPCSCWKLLWMREVSVGIVAIAAEFIYPPKGAAPLPRGPAVRS